MSRYNVKLRVDTGEHATIKKMKENNDLKSQIASVIEILSTNDENVELVPLEVGDYDFVVDGVRTLVIERKEVGDLMSSINGRRFQEQRGRMIMDRRDANNEIMMAFLIEGDLEALKHGHNPKFTEDFYRKRINDLASVYGIGLILTKDAEDTVNYLCYIKKRLQEKGTLQSIESNLSLLDVLPVGRKRDLTPEEWNILSYAHISGITMEAAKAIYHKWGHIGALWTIYSDMSPRDNPYGLLQDLEYGDGKKLNYAQSKSVYHKIMDQDIPEEYAKAPKPKAPNRKKTVNPKKRATKAKAPRKSKNVK